MKNKRSTADLDALSSSITKSRLKHLMNGSCGCLNCVTPPHILIKLAESDDKNIRRIALKSLMSGSQMRGKRQAMAGLVAAAPGDGRRTIFDCRNGTDPATAVVVRSEDGP